MPVRNAKTQVDVTVGLVTSAGGSTWQRALASLLAQSGVVLDCVVFAESSAPLKLPEDLRVTRMDWPESRERTALLQSLCERSDARAVMLIEPTQQLLPGSLGQMLATLDSESACDGVLGLKFSANKSGHVSRACYRDQWEASQALVQLQPPSLHDFIHRDFLPDNPRLIRRSAIDSRRKQFRTREASVWDLHATLRFALHRQPVCIDLDLDRDQKGVEPRAPGASAQLFRRTIELLRDAPSIGSGLQRRYALHQAWLLASKQVRVRLAQIRERAWRWQTGLGLSASCYGWLVKRLARWPLPGEGHAQPSPEAPGRVLYFIWQYPVLSQTFVQREVAALRRHGVDVVVAAQDPTSDDFLKELADDLLGTDLDADQVDDRALEAAKRTYFRRHPIRFLALALYVLGRSYHPRKSWQFDRWVFDEAFRLAELCRRQNACHVHSPWADNCAFVAMIAARIHGVPFSFQARAHDLHRDDYRPYLGEKAEGARFIVTNTRYNADELQALLPAPQHNKIEVIHNGLNLSRFNAEDLGAERNPTIRLLAVGRLIDQKGFEYLLRSCRALLDAGHTLRCDIIGGPEDLFMACYVNLKRLRRDLELETEVCFHGAMAFDAVLDYYARADIFVLPCVIAEDGSRDIIPNAVLEAMAMALPVVSTTVTGLPEMVEQGVTGVLVEPGETVALTDALDGLMQSPDTRKRYGQAGRARVERLFDSHKNTLSYRALFARSFPSEHAFAPGSASASSVSRLRSLPPETPLQQS